MLTPKKPCYVTGRSAGCAAGREADPVIIFTFPGSFALCLSRLNGMAGSFTFIAEPIIVEYRKESARRVPPSNRAIRRSGAPRAKARGSSTCFIGRNPPKHTLLRSFRASKGTLSAFIHGLRDRGFLRRRVKPISESRKSG